jgi:hypothetical protein
MSSTHKVIHRLPQIAVVALLGYCAVTHRQEPRIGVQPKGPLSIQMSRLKQLFYLLEADAGQHDGHYPDSYPPVLPTGDPDQLGKFRDPMTRTVSDWLYFPGHAIQDGNSAVLMASPPTVVGERDRQRVVLYCDGTTAIIREKAYQEQFARQASPP